MPVGDHVVAPEKDPVERPGPGDEAFAIWRRDHEFDEFVTTLKEQAKSIGIDPEKATDKIVMRLNLT